MYYIINKNFIIKKDEKIIPILCILQQIIDFIDI